MPATIQDYWEKLYSTKSPNEVSWTESEPTTSLKLISELQPDKKAPIIDIGGGDSHLVDYLIKAEYQDVTVLDISESSIKRAKERLGKAAENVTWICSDILEFKPTTQYAFWHDRACFHFLTEKQDIEKYINLVNRVVYGGLVIATFSNSGPVKCSGLPITQYSEQELILMFEQQFQPVTCMEVIHKTPFDTEQNFTFCSFERKADFE